jgi:hypothetical protein
MNAALIAAVLGLFLALFLTPGASAYTFGAPNVSQTAPESTVFDHTTQACQQDDIPDISARALKDSLGRTQLVVSHYNTRRELGTNLNNVTHNCNVVLFSDVDSDPSHYNDAEWLHSMYTLDGQTIYGFIHHEYQGWNFYEQCAALVGTPDINKCWYNSVTFATSTDSGNSYTQAPVPNHLLASQPYQFVPLQGPYGIYRPSSIVARSDGYYYMMVLTEPHGAQERGACLLRTKTLGSPTSWRAWDGNAFTVRFINPYVETSEPPEKHVCAPVSQHALRGFEINSLTYNTYYQKYMIVGQTMINNVPGFYFALSDDLLHWTEPDLLMEGELPFVSHVCGDPNPVRDGAVLDPNSPTRNFETVGQTGNLYFTRFNYFYDGSGNCSMTLDRDLIKIPIQFSGAPPTASFTYLPSIPDIGDSVTFNATGSSDSDGTITQYWWDFDGDGFFETYLGNNPITTTSFDKIKGNNVGLRVIDQDGLADEMHIPVKVDAQIDNQPGWASTEASYVADSGAAYDDTRGYGWVRQDSLGNATHTPLDLTKNAFDRDPFNSDRYPQRQDTGVFMQYPANGSNPRLVKTPGAFEVAVPCGVYQVTVSVGDSAWSSFKTKPGEVSTHRINVEGQNLIAGFTPTDQNKFATAADTISVCDGRLTIDAIGGTNTKLNSVDIRRKDTLLNIQPSWAGKPSNYAKDAGAPYSDTRGFGWVRQDSLANITHTPLDLSANTFDRDPFNVDAFQQRQDTGVFMQYPTNGSNPRLVKTPGAFEVALPCGDYQVTVSVGDSAFSSIKTKPGDVSTHRINIEGTNAIAGFVPNDQNKFATATRTVSVCDGRLTIDATGGGVNTKLNYVDVVRVN